MCIALLVYVKAAVLVINFFASVVNKKYIIDMFLHMTGLAPLKGNNLQLMNANCGFETVILYYEWCMVRSICCRDSPGKCCAIKNTLVHQRLANVNLEAALVINSYLIT